MSLEGKVAVVTGGARGIGQAVAVELARSGADIVFCDICPDEQAARTLELVRGHGRKARFIRADVGNRSQVELMFREIVDQFGRIDILVNNAAVNKRKPLVDLSIEDVEKVWSVALWGVFHCSQLAARQMVQQKSGSIVVISSVHAVQPFPNNTAYNGAKAAVNHMARTWAAELVGDNIRVNVVEPGWTDTPGERTLYSEEEIQREGSRLPMGHLASRDGHCECSSIPGLRRSGLYHRKLLAGGRGTAAAKGDKRRRNRWPRSRLKPFRRSTGRSQSWNCLRSHEQASHCPELVEQSRFPRSSIHYLLVTLERRGYVQRNERTSRYLFGVNLVQLANSAWSGLSLRQQAAPFLGNLVRRAQMTAHMAILKDNEAVIVAKHSPLDGPRTATWVGKRMDVHCTGLGKALIAYLSRA